MTEAKRVTLVRRGLWLNYVTIAYNALEAVVSLVAGLLAGSVALVGFGFDSVTELTASRAAQWRFRTDLDVTRHVPVERITIQIVGWCFIALATYVGYESTKALWLRERPDRSVAGIVILSACVIVMPPLARAKHRVANAMNSRILASEATQTSLCAYLSVIAPCLGHAQCVVRLAVGGSDRGARDGTNHRSRRHRWTRGARSRRLLLGEACDAHYRIVTLI